MTPEAQRIAIAEACGRKPDPETGFWYHLYSEIAGFRDGAVAPLPDYLNDLNAMHEAEKTLEITYDKRWIEAILEIAFRETAISFVKSNGYDWVVLVYPLSAAQRAEAFLRTLNLWTDEK